MENAYTFVASTNKKHADIFSNHFVSDLREHDKMLEQSNNWRSDGIGQDEYGTIYGYLYVPKSGLMKVHFDKKGLIGAIIFSAVEEPTLREMAGDIGIVGVEDKCIRKGITNYKKD